MLFKTQDKKPAKFGFWFFLSFILLAIFALQLFVSEEDGEVGFSYQLEHLVNLDLLDGEESVKVATDSGLVTFAGKFRDATTQLGRNRFEYLTALDTSKDLDVHVADLQVKVANLRAKIADSAKLFLAISGEKVPSKGYDVIDANYSVKGARTPLVVDAPAPVSVHSLKHMLAVLPSTGSSDIKNFRQQLLGLITAYRSLELGITNPHLVQILKKDETAILQDISQNKDLSSSDQSLNSAKTLYNSILKDLTHVTTTLNTKNDGYRLGGTSFVAQYNLALHETQGAVKDALQASSVLAQNRSKVANDVWFFQDKEISARDLEQLPYSALHSWIQAASSEWNHFEDNKGLLFEAPDQKLNKVLETRFKSRRPTSNYFGQLFGGLLLPMLLIGSIFYFFVSRHMKGVGSSAMNFGKSPAKLSEVSNEVTFQHVAGAEEAKEELMEIVEFLKNPEKFTALGAKIPRGVLLVGAPGTGKTLIAKAVAGEAERPFFSISGSDFVEMFVGVGASRIRDMFATAKKSSPCIIFMDEIDAVGRHRGVGVGGGHDEREQTLNQLLVEMDGFNSKDGIILIAATNRPDILDAALLRPGRFDRRVTLDLPDIKGRYDILKVHARRIKIDSAAELKEVAKKTAGCSGADLENILNESALSAAMLGRSAVTQGDLQQACDKVMLGKARRSLDMNDKEKMNTAYHESGHAIVALILKHSDPVDKVTIIPRGWSLGATHMLPEKNRVGYRRKEAIDYLAIMMGGRAAEDIFIKDQLSGVSGDIVMATDMARKMVCEWGMSSLGMISFRENDAHHAARCGHPTSAAARYSEETSQKIDKEIAALINDASATALRIVSDNKEKTQLMADMLMKFETLNAKDLQEIIEGTFDENKKKDRVAQEKDLFIEHNPIKNDVKPDAPLNDGASPA